MRTILVSLLIAALAALAVAAPASAAQPKAGSWFSSEVDPKDEDNLSSIQFKVAKNRKKLVQFTIYWRCGNESGYHSFRNPPIPIGINKQQRFKLVGMAEAPSGQSQPSREFTLKGKFISRTKASYSMKLKGCGPWTRGKLSHADS